jgi:hypothetical protein
VPTNRATAPAVNIAPENEPERKRVGLEIEDTVAAMHASSNRDGDQPTLSI